MYEKVLGDGESPQLDGRNRCEPPVTSSSPADHVPSEREPDHEWNRSLQIWLEGDSHFRKPFRPWMYVLGGILLVALAILSFRIVFGSP